MIRLIREIIACNSVSTRNRLTLVLFQWCDLLEGKCRVVIEFMQIRSSCAARESHFSKSQSSNAN